MGPLMSMAIGRAKRCCMKKPKININMVADILGPKFGSEFTRML